VPHELSFDILHEYSASDAANGILLPIALSSGQSTVTLKASLDTGAAFCIFERGYGESLGLDVEAGLLTRFGTATGIFEAYGHTVTISAFGLTFEAMVYFAKEESYGRNVLGRRGWLDQVRVGIVEYESKLYLSRYDEP
jgi:hypothetical protein